MDHQPEQIAGEPIEDTTIDGEVQHNDNQNNSEDDQKAKLIAEEIFRKFDLDNSGTIDKEEAKKIFVDIMKRMNFTRLDVSDDTLEHWFKLADTNGDN